MLARLKQTGLLYSAAIVFNRIVPAWLFRFRRQFIYLLKLPDDQAIVSHNFDVGWADTESEYTACENVTLSFRCYQEHGAELLCMQAVDGGNVLGGFWVAPKFFDESELSVRIVLEPHQRWLFSARVAKNARRRGVFSAILIRILQSLERDGLVGLVAVNPVNRGSVLAHQRFVERKLGTMTTCRFLNMTICLVSGQLHCERSFRFGGKPLDVTIRD